VTEHKQGQEWPPRSAAARQRGAALLMAMLTVVLVVTIASAALWQQWRAIEIETAERQRSQAGWILTGALDWARLILREDARGNQNSGNADHLGEPWAMPLEEARLSSFLAVDKDNSADSVMQAFLSGEVIDQQSRLNFMNVVRVTGSGAQAKAELSRPDLDSLTRLFQLLDLPQTELESASQALLASLRAAATDPAPSATPLVPTRFAQLTWLGLSQASLAALEPHLTVLPERTLLNLNTASAQAISASIPGLDLAQAQRIVAERERSPFKTLIDVRQVAPGLPADQPDSQHHDVRSRYFEVRGRLRLDGAIIEERSLVVRDGLVIRVRWRERTALG
jgi:general secretion pathway protein K